MQLPHQTLLRLLFLIMEHSAHLCAQSLDPSSVSCDEIRLGPEEMEMEWGKQGGPAPWL